MSQCSNSEVAKMPLQRIKELHNEVHILPKASDTTVPRASSGRVQILVSR